MLSEIFKRLTGILVLLIYAGLEIYSQTPADSVIALDAVNVEAYQISSSLRTLPGGISVMTGEELKAEDRSTLYNNLNALPGVNMQSGTFTTNRIVIRGMGSRTPYNTNRLRFYMNDIPLTSSEGLSSPEETEPENIGRLELIKGPSSALYGSGLGGSLNIFTPVTDGNERTAGIQYGSYNTWKVSLSNSLHTEHFDSRISAAHLRSDGWRQNSEYKRTSILSTTSINGKKSKLDLLLLLTGVYSGIPSSVGKTIFNDNPKLAASNWNAIGGFKKYFRGVAGVTLSSRLSGRSTNKMILFGRLYDNYEKRPFNNLDDISISAGLRNKTTIHFDNAEFVAGAELITEQYKWELDTSAISINRNRENRQQVNIFTGLHYRPVGSINISAAAALNYIAYRLTDLFATNGDQSGNRRFPFIFSPRLGISYSPARQLSVYASAGHGFSMPSPEETLLPEGNVNKNIRHEQGWQFEAGSRVSFLNDRLQADITWYMIRLQDLLVTKRLTEDIFTGVNAGRTNHMGIEIAAKGGIMKLNRFPGSLDAVLSFSASANRFLTFSENDISFKGKTLPGIPSRVLYFQASWEPLKTLEFLIDCRYTGRQFLNDANTLDYGSYFLVNARVRFDFNMGSRSILSFYAGISNITNTVYASMLIVNAVAFGSNEPRYYYPGNPRNGFAGISFLF